MDTYDIATTASRYETMEYTTHPPLKAPTGLRTGRAPVGVSINRRVVAKVLVRHEVLSIDEAGAAARMAERATVAADIVY